jgi:tetrahydromethanopterin S-methyltransferase subunit C
MYGFLFKDRIIYLLTKCVTWVLQYFKYLKLSYRQGIAKKENVE